MLNALMFLLRKYMHYSTFRNHPHLFFQTERSEGGTALSPLALSLLETKYPEKAYMEFVQKQTQQGTLIAQFQRSSHVGVSMFHHSWTSWCVNADTERYSCGRFILASKFGCDL